MRLRGQAATTNLPFDSLAAELADTQVGGCGNCQWAPVGASWPFYSPGPLGRAHEEQGRAKPARSLLQPWWLEPQHGHHRYLPVAQYRFICACWSAPPASSFACPWLHALPPCRPAALPSLPLQTSMEDVVRSLREQSKAMNRLDSAGGGELAVAPWELAVSGALFLPEVCGH